ncbi:hypothetical protein [Streptomyces flaveolus]|uniref:hypothetical protein n=1 Tax=Streptomyces flaveolus TaxID=67297 RepID=UPI0036F508D0
MNVTRSGYVCTRPDILADLREEAARTRAHQQFTETAITAFEEDGPDAEPLLSGCPESIAHLIFDEVAEAYDAADRAARDAASATTWVRECSPSPTPATAARGPDGQPGPTGCATPAAWTGSASTSRSADHPRHPRRSRTPARTAGVRERSPFPRRTGPSTGPAHGPATRWPASGRGAVIWIDGQWEKEERFRLMAPSSSEARALVIGQYGEGHVISVWNEEDARRPS